MKPDPHFVKSEDRGSTRATARIGGGGFPYPYLQESLAESTHKLRQALAKS